MESIVFSMPTGDISESQWRTLYQSALFETDLYQLPRRIKEAERAIRACMNATERSGDETEPIALSKALSIMSDLHAMLKSQTQQVQDDLNRNGVRFINLEVEIGLTMIDMALGANRTSEKMVRNTRNARRAHDSVLHFRKRLRFTSDEERDLGIKLQKLKSALHQLGEAV